jgi:hypothetical protein
MATQTLPIRSFGSSGIPETPLSIRATAVVAVLVTAAVHVPVAVQHLPAVPYLGVAFYTFVILNAAAAGSLLVDDHNWIWTGLATLNASAIVAYLISRTTGLPGALDDRSDWTNQAGMVALVAELVVVTLALQVLKRRQT